MFAGSGLQRAVTLRCNNPVCDNGIGFLPVDEERVGLVLRCRLCSDVFFQDMPGHPTPGTLRGADVLVTCDSAGAARDETLRRYGLAA